MHPSRAAAIRGQIRNAESELGLAQAEVRKIEGLITEWRDQLEDAREHVPFIDWGHGRPALACACGWDEDLTRTSWRDHLE